MAALGLGCCAGAFSSCGRRGCPSLRCQASHSRGSSPYVWSAGLSRSAGFRSSSQALQQPLSSCGVRAQLFHSMRSLPEPGIKAVSPHRQARPYWIVKKVSRKSRKSSAPVLEKMFLPRQQALMSGRIRPRVSAPTSGLCSVLLPAGSTVLLQVYR